MKELPYIVLRVVRPPDLGEPFFGAGTLALGSGAASEGAQMSLDLIAPPSKRERAALKSDHTVRAIVPAVPVQLIKPAASEEAVAPTATGATWGAIATRAVESPYKGKGVVVAVLDTGIDALHEAFHKVKLVQKDFTGEGNGDHDGHGTHVAGTIFGREIKGFRFGLAPGVQHALIGKVLDSTGSGSSDQIAKGIMWAAQKGANIINISIGIDYPGLVAYYVERNWPTALATSRALESYRTTLRLFDSLVEWLNAQADVSQSTLLVAAAGNESKREEDPNYEIAVCPPAAANGVISVGALQTAGEPHDRLTVAGFSNTGANIVAPGVGIYSCAPGGGYLKMSGTSMASPHVTGVAALWAEKLLKETGRLKLDHLIACVMGRTSGERLAVDVDSLDIGAGLVQAPLD